MFKTDLATDSFIKYEIPSDLTMIGVSPTFYIYENYLYVLKSFNGKVVEQIYKLEKTNTRLHELSRRLLPTTPLNNKLIE